MADKLSYEELEQRVRQLDKEVAELKRSEEGWRSLVKNAPSPIITVDRDGIIRDINQAVAGFEIEKVVGTSHYDYAPPEYHKVMKESVEQVFKTGKSVSYEIAGVGPEGSTSWYVTRLGPVKRGGEVVGVTIMPMDITERKRMEDELRENEQKHRALVESSIDGIYIAVGQEIIFANMAALENFGCRSADEMVGHSWTEFVSPEYRDMMVKRGLDRVKGEDVPSRYEFKALRKDGTQFDAELSVSVISYNNRMASQGVVRDITERKRLEDELSESEERYRTIFEGAAEGIVVADIKTKKFRYSNPAMCRMFGYSRKEFADMGVSDIHPEEAMEHVISEFDAQMREEKTLAPNIPCLHKDGRIMYADIHSTKILIDNTECGVGFFSDITERKQAQEALVAAKTRVEDLLELSPATIYTCKTEGSYPATFVSPNIKEQLGYDPKNFINDSSFWADHIHPEDAPGVFAQLSRLFEKGRHTHEYRFLHKDGTYRWMLDDLRLVRDADGSPLEIVGFWTDITGRKNVEEELRIKDKAIASSINAMAFADLEGNVTYVNDSFVRLWGYDNKEVLKESVTLFWEKKEIAEEVIQALRNTGGWSGELVGKKKDDSLFHVQVLANTVINDDGKPICMMSSFIDITERKQAEEALRERETSLEIQADELQEINTALRVLLRQRDKDKAELEEKVFLNVRELVMPHVEKLKKSTIDARQKGYLRVLESNLNEIISPFAHRLSSKYSTLTPTEIQMAFLIRDGKSTKEIADLLSLSGRTVESHRQSIRMKMGIRNRRANLRSHLLSM
jgi:PAS domain S-box-containing protein